MGDFIEVRCGSSTAFTATACSYGDAPWMPACAGRGALRRIQPFMRLLFSALSIQQHHSSYNSLMPISLHHHSPTLFVSGHDAQRGHV